MYLDSERKMFWQVVDEPKKKGNYLETSGTLMIAYTIFKGSSLLVYCLTNTKKLGKKFFMGPVTPISRRMKMEFYL